MIDKLPLDLFGNDEPEDPEPSAPVTATCPWCAAEVAADASTCPACEARILPSESAAPTVHNGTCQWCGTAIALDSDACPTCGWDAHGDNETELPGLTTPLSEAEIRALYGGDDPELDTDDTIALASEIISLILPHG